MKGTETEIEMPTDHSPSSRLKGIGEMQPGVLRDHMIAYAKRAIHTLTDEEIRACLSVPQGIQAILEGFMRSFIEAETCDP